VHRRRRGVAAAGGGAGDGGAGGGGRGGADDDGGGAGTGDGDGDAGDLPFRVDADGAKYYHGSKYPRWDAGDAVDDDDGQFMSVDDAGDLDPAYPWVLPWRVLNKLLWIMDDVADYAPADDTADGADNNSSSSSMAPLTGAAAAAAAAAARGSGSF
jgi:hypothetical protein